MIFPLQSSKVILRAESFVTETICLAVLLGTSQAAMHMIEI
jgi:hypothetical protein